MTLALALAPTLTLTPNPNPNPNPNPDPDPDPNPNPSPSPNPTQAIMRHQLESMATHVAEGADTYSSVHVYYIDDRMDLLDYVGPHIGVTSNAKLIAKLGTKAKALKFSTVRVRVRKG